MEPASLLLGLRVLLALLLYTFLAAVFWMLWRDLRAAAKTSTVRTQKLGRLIVLESSLPSLPPNTVFPLASVTALGRAPTNAVPLPDETCSLEHALLHQREGKWWLEDLGSRNGTQLNGHPVQAPMPILNGDVIGVGVTRLKVELEN